MGFVIDLQSLSIPVEFVIDLQSLSIPVEFVIDLQSIINSDGNRNW